VNVTVNLTRGGKLTATVTDEAQLDEALAELPIDHAEIAALELR
jgi:hypothetical protein